MPTKSKGSVPAALDTPTDLSANAIGDISGALNGILADSFALYLKTKNFHWHVSGPHFRDYHLMLDEQAADIFATTDELAERVRKIGGTTLRSIGQIAKLQSLDDNDEEFVTPADMLRELVAQGRIRQQLREQGFGILRGLVQSLAKIGRAGGSHPMGSKGSRKGSGSKAGGQSLMNGASSIARRRAKRPQTAR